MLLYDHVREKAELMLRKHGPGSFGRINCQTLLALRDAVVYEISSVIPLFGDWAVEKEKAVPKKPPHPVVWAEWRYSDHSESRQIADEWTLGVLVVEMSDKLRKELAEIPIPHVGGGQQLSDFLSSGKDFYVVHMFKRIDHVAFLHGFPRDLIGIPLSDFGTFIWSQNPDGTGVHRHKTLPKILPGQETLDADQTVFFMPVLDSIPERDPYFQCADPWPAFMAFAMLHCKNIVVEDNVPDQRTQHRVKKAGNPPRITYKVLRIEVPVTVTNRGGYVAEQEDDGPKVRFHLCSGHFKNLQHERFKNKGWHWWPAHWRGSKDLGEVHKRFRLDSTEPTVETPGPS